MVVTSSPLTGWPLARAAWSAAHSVSAGAITTPSATDAAIPGLTLKYLCQCLNDAVWHKWPNVASQSRNFFHDSRADVGVLFLRHHENCFQSWFHFPIHQRHLKLELKIRDRSKTAHNCKDILSFREIDQQAVQS